MLFKNTCQIIVFKIRVITKIVCSFLFSKKIEEGSYFELFVKFPFFFQDWNFSVKTLQPYKSFGKNCSQQNDCRNACCQNSVHFFILKIGNSKLHFYYTDNKFTILRNGIFYFSFFRWEWKLLKIIVFIDEAGVFVEKEKIVVNFHAFQVKRSRWKQLVLQYPVLSQSITWFLNRWCVTMRCKIKWVKLIDFKI